MPHGKAARQKNWKKAAKAKAVARKIQKRTAKSPTMDLQPRQLSIPMITEDDLLSFQFSHFGDDTKPDNFFTDPEHALNYCLVFEDTADDGLGWYEDGVKRTLTDEQIAMFRHTEIEQLKRQRRLEAEEKEEVDDDDDDYYEPPEPEDFTVYALQPQSPVSDASSLEAELAEVLPTKQPKHNNPQSKPKKQRSQTRHRESVQSRNLLSPRSRQRKVEVPYDKRNKRKWENYIDDRDPVHGSMTRRRLVRELDEQQSNNVAINYGDDEPPPPKPTPMPTMPGRRIVSYEDD